jgi:uncharacterized tellurite resistance protein B-like protein
MNLLEKKRLNLLVHLAKADGRFTKSEHALLLHFAQQKGLAPEGVAATEEPLHISDFTDAHDKLEILHWALRMMHADAVVHEKEIAFCRQLATKMGLREEIVTHYATRPLPEFATFCNEVNRL